MKKLRSKAKLVHAKAKDNIMFERSFLGKNVVFVKRIFLFTKLFTKGFFGHYQEVFYAFILPSFLAFVIYLIFAQNYKTPPGGTDPLAKATLIYGLSILPVLTLSITMLGQSIAFWKRSIFIKRIESTPISRVNFITSLLFFYWIVAIFGQLWMLFWNWFILLIFNKLSYANEVYNQISGGWMTLAVILIPLASIPVGIILGGICNSATQAQAIGLTIFFPTIFLSGVAISPSVLDKTAGFRYFTYVIPFKYAVFLNLIAWYGGKLPSSVPNNYFGPYVKPFQEFPYVWIPILVLIAWMFVFLIIARFTFRYEVKN